MVFKQEDISDEGYSNDDKGYIFLIKGIMITYIGVNREQDQNDYNGCDHPTQKL